MFTFAELLKFEYFPECRKIETVFGVHPTFNNHFTEECINRETTMFSFGFLLHSSLLILSCVADDKMNGSFPVVHLDEGSSVNKTTQSPSSTPKQYCNKQFTLQNNMRACVGIDYCCVSQVYEAQYNNERANSSASPFLKNLYSCRATCLSKVPPMSVCTRQKQIYEYYRMLNSCYDSCFAGAYNCPSVYYSNIVSKSISVAEIIIITVMMCSFALCLFKTTCGRDFDFSMSRRPSHSSKVHVARTSDENYSNV